MKRESRVPKRLIDEYQSSSQGRKKAKCSKDNKLYEVEIVEVDKEKKKVKIHFKGYGHETDEWRDYDEDNVPFQRLEKVYEYQILVALLWCEIACSAGGFWRCRVDIPVGRSGRHLEFGKQWRVGAR